MRNSTHPGAAATKGAGVDQAHTIRVQFYPTTAPLPVELQFKELELLCTEDAFHAMENFAFVLASYVRRVDRPVTSDGLLEAMVWVLINNGITADEIKRAAGEADKAVLRAIERGRKRIAALPD